MSQYGHVQWFQTREESLCTVSVEMISLGRQKQIIPHHSWCGCFLGTCCNIWYVVTWSLKGNPNPRVGSFFVGRELSTKWEARKAAQWRWRQKRGKVNHKLASWILILSTDQQNVQGSEVLHLSKSQTPLQRHPLHPLLRMELLSISQRCVRPISSLLSHKTFLSLTLQKRY